MIIHQLYVKKTQKYSEIYSYIILPNISYLEIVREYVKLKKIDTIGFIFEEGVINENFKKPNIILDAYFKNKEYISVRRIEIVKPDGEVIMPYMFDLLFE